MSGVGHGERHLQRRLRLSVVIPTYRRGESLIRTISELVSAETADEIIVVDQTGIHPQIVERELGRMSSELPLRRLTLSIPSIPAAMNRGLIESRNDLVLFLDDDATAGDHLLSRHIAAHSAPGVGAVAGRVVQPYDTPRRKHGPELLEDLDFDFSSIEATSVRNVMAGNLSVKRAMAIEIGGFDENFVGVAYRFESDFARRMVEAGAQILYEPEACIRHRKEPSGGTRAFGDHRRSSSPAHSVGDYYFALRHLQASSFARFAARRIQRNLLTRYHLQHPWWIPSKMIGELRGLILAMTLYHRGPKLIERDVCGS